MVPTLERVYQVFAKYPHRRHLDACPCCRKATRTVLSQSASLNELTASDLGRYAFSAITTVGDVDDFRHFLPRILELLSDAAFLETVDLEVVLSKLSYGRWQSWPQEEQEAVQEHLRFLWASALVAQQSSDAASSQPELGQWLCAFARAEIDLTSYLNAWRESRSPFAQAQLASFLEEYQTELLNGSAPEGHWEDAAMQWRQVVGWAAAARCSSKETR